MKTIRYPENIHENLIPCLNSGTIWCDEPSPVLYSKHLPDPPFRMDLDSETFSLLSYCNGDISIEKIAHQLSVNVSEVCLKICDLEKKASGMFYFEGDDQFFHVPEKQEIAAKIFHEWSSVEEHEDGEEIFHYHQNEIQNAWKQFEEIETTVSHLFHIPHPSLQMRSYGEAFVDQVLQKRLLNGNSIVEVGCGTGIFARDFLNGLKEAHPDLYRQASYALFDLAPALQGSQRMMCADHSGASFISGNMLEIKKLNLRADLIISNEVIADLPVAPVFFSGSEYQGDSIEANRILHSYPICYPKKNTPFLLNTGAIRFIEQLSGILSKNGTAILTEYGSETEFPSAVQLKGHREHAIHFGHLLTVSKVLGLEAELLSLGDFLGFDGDVEVVDFDTLDLISRCLLPALEMPGLDRYPYTLSDLKERIGPLAGKIGNLQVQKLKDQRGLSPFAFFALILRKIW